MPAVSSLPIAAVVDSCSAGAAAGVTVTEGDRLRLYEALGSVPDPRARRGVRYPLAAVVAVAVCATLAGARSFAAIGEWVADLTSQQRAAVGLTGSAPGSVTIWRVLVRLNVAAVEAVLTTWITSVLAVGSDATTPGAGGRRRRRRALAVDGKAMRATRHGTSTVHLLAAVDHHHGVVLAQVDVDAKTNEIPLFSVLLDQIPELNGVVVTVDALHAQTAHAEYLHTRGAHLLVAVKGNQPTLLATLRALPWRDVPVGHTASGRGHGRAETRTVKAVTVPAGLGFPHAAQALQVTRRTRPLRRKGTWRTETVYAITTLRAEDATTADLAAWIRGHWTIENRLHWVRDVTFGEDLHQARTGSGPQAMAILRNLAITLLRLSGHTNIARALRHHARHPTETIMLLTSDYRTLQ